MKLSEAMLDLARFAGTVYRGTATGGSTTSLQDSAQYEPDRFFNGGTLWVLSGENAGKVVRISLYSSNTFTFPALSHTIRAGDQYASADRSFPLHILREAINQALIYFKVPKYNETLTINSGVDSYTLPEGVSDVRRVEIATFSESPYGWEQINWWREVNGKLEIRGGLFLEDVGLKIRLIYAANHGEVAMDGEIDPLVEAEYLRYAGAVYLWRNYIQRQGTDKTKAPDFFNESKILEMEARARAMAYAKVPGKSIQFCEGV